MRASSDTVAYGAAASMFWIGSVGGEVSRVASTNTSRYHRLAAVPFSVVNDRNSGSAGSVSTGSRVMVSMTL
jgi:hypothetical protein